MAITQRIPFNQVIEVHQQIYRPAESRFSTASARAWGAKYPPDALKVGKNAYWMESWQRMGDKQRAYTAKIIDLETGVIDTLELDGISPIMGDTSKTKVTKAFKLYIHRLRP